MNTTLYRDRLNTVEYHLRSMRHKIDMAIETNRKRDVVVALSRDSATLVEDIKSLRRDLSILDTIVRKEEVAYKKRRLGFVDGKITECLKYIFPNQHLIAQTDCNFERKQTKLRLYLKDKLGNLRPPFVTEGKGAQQLISYSAVQSSLFLLNRNKLYLDEPFSNASEMTLIKIQSLLKSSIDMGFQVILVSQSGLVYNDLERREILLQCGDDCMVSDVIIQDYIKEGEESEKA